ncbi:MAG: hypothetical protein AAGA48_30440 [Myxococcota bacterium]
MSTVMWALFACMTGTPPVDPSPMPLMVGDTREVVLHTFPFDVEGFRLELDEADLRALPPEVLDEVWLVDLPLTPMVDGIVRRLGALSAAERQRLDPASSNLQQLIAASADSLSLEGTSLEPLEALSGAVGIPIARPLADLFAVGVTEPLLPAEVLVPALAQGLVASHPAAREGALPVSMGDLLRGFDDLAERFGPADTPLGRHPGFLAAASDVQVLGENFAVAFLVNANPLPFAGVDLTDASGARQNPIGSQIESLFATERPDWISIEGLVPEPSVGSLALVVTEDAEFQGPTPALDDRFGSPAFSLPPWAFERVLIEAAFAKAVELDPIELTYRLGTGTPVFNAVLDEAGVATFTTFADVGPPPPPRLLWDIVLEISQTRLHDGGIVEGQAQAIFELADVSLGFDAKGLTEQVEANLAANPEAVRPLAVAVTENGVGAPDVFYRPRIDGDTVEDWLWFVQPDDIPRRTGVPDREYTYTTVGFYEDAELTEKLSTNEAVFGDITHEKVQVAEGDVLYVADDDGAVFELTATGKPSRSRLSLQIRRVR